MSRPLRFAVDDLAAAVRFYTTMFASPPAALMPGCARWRLDGSGLQFTICARDAMPPRSRPSPPCFMACGG